MSCKPKRPEERVRFFRRGATTAEEFRELRTRAMARVARGESVREVARDMSVSEDTISQWLSRARKGRGPGPYVPSQRLAFHGPCAEPGCGRRCASKHGYCQKHASVYVYRATGQGRAS
ncbi:helix-turn-helix domain-containing protein [Corallococcus sp. AS-1-6]|uniref:helix-turn-helix domain-containing protein n=1 Tax=Corallococcus sp. AS-1-6 TaxID=2874599 RepID=UPI001CBF104C|nr:helix-turn-helix domain-containing protein [Corallococcus sp. AS-1-6]